MEARLPREDVAKLVTVAKRRAARHRPQADGWCGECNVKNCEPLQTALRFLELHAGPPEPILHTQE